MLPTVKKLLLTMPRNLILHSKRVGLLAYILSKQIGLSKEESINIALGGLLHDIGKCFIQPSILYKKGRLTEKEFIEVKKHCDYGVNVINQYYQIHFLFPIVKYHHERWDGFGYSGLKEKEIPLEARIISLVDAFDAMTSLRPYQKTKSLREALDELNRCSGSQFDPYLVKEFNLVFEKQGDAIDDYRQFIRL
ncbi:HD-GYP domain-containing protein [Desulforamulus ruminis]|uniref:Metal-dependent phosphohydrolase HD sub domain protein n=1 Tax=Desulforamulus ruminis (strain ATCC 23193 / DSM 2154 / NCIMB 8452 / DL) TaxID=696281 RepID=F6DUE7_DESRL|nr:HD domain-containing phosphohydrolase [Desulforamulus ruminis]AEG61332.1 metal-dependent phosphohydrolase HD sub domain protein [Desulforamulus ruminis DSM 2154]